MLVPALIIGIQFVPSLIAETDTTANPSCTDQSFIVAPLKKEVDGVFILRQVPLIGPIRGRKTRA
ncbi:hypothetical protein NPIL_166221, partial [Nephila pilipes]